MSDKDECVEMSEEITPTDEDDRSVKLPRNSEGSPESKHAKKETYDNELDDAQSLPNTMGQVKSKIKELGRPRKKSSKEEAEDGIEIAEADGNFMCGVVEGFYGRPWTTGQRKELFRR